MSVFRLMTNKKGHFSVITLIAISLLFVKPMMGQTKYPFMTKEIDSICRTTLDYIWLKNSLIRQQYEALMIQQQNEAELEALRKEHGEIEGHRALIDKELEAVNRQIDSITPKRPEGPRPKVNLMDLIQEGLTFTGNYGLNINQLALSNWAAGGENSSTGKAFANLTLLYQKSTHEHKLVGTFAYGISRFADKRIEKSDDKIDLSYTLSLHSKQRWKYSLVSTFNTQFANGYKYPNDSTVISGFFAPAYLTLSGGVTYKTQNNAFDIYASPLAGKVTFVMIQSLADQGAFGVKKGYYDADSIWIPGKNVLPALGANIIINYKQPIGKSITYATVLNCFYNYFEEQEEKRLKLDVNWENTINFNITKSITTVLFLHFKYDHNTLFADTKIIDGVETSVNVPKLQFKESLGIAFIHKF